MCITMIANTYRDRGSITCETNLKNGIFQFGPPFLSRGSGLLPFSYCYSDTHNILWSIIIIFKFTDGRVYLCRTGLGISTPV